MNAARVVVTVVFTADPLGPKVGGAETFIRGFLEHAPAHFDLRYVGVTCDPVRRPVGTWSVSAVARFGFCPFCSNAMKITSARCRSHCVSQPY